MKIYVYAISKNEIDFADRWYASMKEADGIFVMDTGSDDGTDKRLRELGCTVTRKTVAPWRFDTARNRSLDFVPEDADLVVCTDLDEYFSEPGWRRKIEDACETERKKTGSYPNQIRYTYIHSFEDDGTPATMYTYQKIHARHGFSWRRMLHEMILPDVGTELHYICIPDLVLEHHTKDKEVRRSSQTDLCKRWVKEEPWNPEAHSYMAHYLVSDGLVKEALTECDMALVRYEDVDNYSPNAFAKILINRSKICKALGDPDGEELSLLRALNVCRNDREAALELAELYLARRKWFELGMTGYRGMMMPLPKDGMFNNPIPLDATNYKLAYLSFIGFANSGRKHDAEQIVEFLRKNYYDVEEVKNAIITWDSAPDKGVFFSACRTNKVRVADNW